MTRDQQVLADVDNIINGLPADDVNTVRQLITQIEGVIAPHGPLGALAVAFLGAKLAAIDD